MSERTTSRVIPPASAHDSIPLLTEVIELPPDIPLRSSRQAAPSAGVVDTSGMAPSGLVTQVGDTGAEDDGEAVPPLSQPVHAPVEAIAGAYAAQQQVAAGPAGDEELRAMRSELLTRVMMRFRAEWPQVVEAHTEATLHARLAPLTAQLAAELTRSLEARLVEWLDATLEEIEGDPGGY
ncbi:hypothetical protein BKK79_14975 [Cupriavidus sp. USMAA2-4]|uniref:DUF2486 family protein n=1 Tax=Cupriavidus malaysiensis TaxID=367825 RepID=A0ABM6F732_9BURK|nr:MULTISPECIES: hypothetical protein [Cupriavidus]AOY92945.1 hypothetical protein BKK79_14975 [Cupriavidus sp. USMAA2-4]AOZ00638.1 hypothetical protein BKK81_16365 [Cupriavidus sp. USMAHM13]AOZ07396.1 hypothetical protein BKK80_17375 [Cupriavidus malaysiensis]